MSYRRVHRIDKLDLAFVKKSPPEILITARAQTSTACWSDPQLSRWAYAVPPKDGVQEFDLVALRPSGILFPELTPVVARGVMKDLSISSYWRPGQPLRGIRIHAATNCIEQRLAESGTAKAVELVEA